MKIVILDTETSGSSQEDRIISLAIGDFSNGNLENLKIGMFNPGVNIKQGSYWVHHISDELVADKPSFRETEFYSILHNIFKSHENIVIGHAICNDLYMIAREGLYCKCRVIDTQYCSVKILKKNKTSLHYLANEFNLLDKLKSSDVKFHTADGDVIVTYHLLRELLKHNTINQLIDISMAPFYDLKLSGEGYRHQRVYNIAAKTKDKLLRHFAVVKDPKVFYSLMYFHGNANLFLNETKKASIMKLLNKKV